jgi:hypothetical protein
VLNRCFTLSFIASNLNVEIVDGGHEPSVPGAAESLQLIGDNLRLDEEEIQVRIDADPPRAVVAALRVSGNLEAFRWRFGPFRQNLNEAIGVAYSSCLYAV